MTITPKILVQREVFYCVSSLVATLAHGAGGASDDLDLLAYQALDLASPIDDWEEAAVQEGWQLDDNGQVWKRFGLGPGPLNGPQKTWADNWLEACERYDIEPYQREVFEHWIVSDWLADKLAEKGEKVDKDFAGLTIWARTTTGQAIAADSVIEEICAELNQRI